MIKIINFILIGIAVFVSKLSAENVCILEYESSLLAGIGFEDVCSSDFGDEILYLNELTKIEDNPVGFNKGGIYKDKHENIWFVKESSPFREYVGGNILKCILGDDKIAEIKLVKGHPLLVASRKLDNFQNLTNLLTKTGESYPRDKTYSLLENNEELVVGMNYVGLSDRHEGNQGYIVNKKGVMEAARIDYDSSFTAKGLLEDLHNRGLFRSYIDYGKLERAIVDLLNLPDDQIHRILENGACLEVFDEVSTASKFMDSYSKTYTKIVHYLEKNKKNFRQLLPLITCLRKVLNEGDISYLDKNKDMLIAFQNEVEPDSQLSYLNIFIHQMVQKGCLDALKKLKELGTYEYSQHGYGFDKEELVNIALETKQDEVLDYLLGDDKLPLAGALKKVLYEQNYENAKELINKIMFLRPNGVIHMSSDDWCSILVESLISNDLNLLKTIVKLGADIKECKPILWSALRFGASLEIIQYLLENGAKEQLSLQPNLIYKAAREKRADVVELFIQHGADPDLLDENGKTAYDYLN